MMKYFQSTPLDRRYGILTLVLIGIGLITFLLTPPLVGNRWGQQQVNPEEIYGALPDAQMKNCALCGRQMPTMGRHQTISSCCEPCGNAIATLRSQNSR